MPNYFQPMNAYGIYPNQIQYPQPNYQNPLPPQPAASNNSQGINWVQGETGAKSFLVGAGQSVLLMDSEADVFYIKSSDPSGMPLPLRIFDYSERVVGQPGGANQNARKTVDMSQFVTYEEFEKFKTEVLNRKKQQNQPIKEGQ